MSFSAHVVVGVLVLLVDSHLAPLSSSPFANPITCLLINSLEYGTVGAIFSSGMTATRRSRLSTNPLFPLSVGGAVPLLRVSDLC
jgi:hypothetical protein